MTTKIEQIIKELDNRTMTAKDISVLIDVPLTGAYGGAYRYMHRIANKYNNIKIVKENKKNIYLTKEE